MTSPIAAPELILGVGTDGNSAGMETPNMLQVILHNLTTGGADVTCINGLNTLVIGAGAIGAAGSVQIGNTETAAEAAANMDCLREIAAFCRTNGIVVQVDACLTNSATYCDGKNALVDQWATAAALAGLPIVSVEDVQEAGICQPRCNYASTASIEANAIKTLIKDYQGSSYTLNASNLGIGDMEGGGASDMANISAWIAALDSANAKLGLQNISYLTADTGWFGPWIDLLSEQSWQSYLEALSSYAASSNISLNIVVQGPETAVSGSQFVMQAEQLAVGLLQLQARGSINVANILAETWQIQPLGDGLLSSPDSQVNEAAELAAVAPLYLSGAISAIGTVTTSAPGQIILSKGTVQSIYGLSVQMTLADMLSGGRLGVVIIDQTGTLSARQFGSGTVSRLAGNILVLSGSAADLAKELASLTVYEQFAGPDTIDVETWGAQGRLSDDQIVVVATAASSDGSVASSSSQQGWLSANDIFNTGTVVGSGSVLTSQTLTWSSSGTTAAGHPAFLKTVAIHEPLAEYGVENTQNGVRDVFDPSIDNGAYPSGGYANNPGVNNVNFANSGWNGGAFNADAELTALIVTSTVKTFDPVTGRLLTSVDMLAPNSPTVIVHGTAVADTFANAFANGGRQVTIMNTGSNPAWQAGWGGQFSSAILTYDGAGNLVEEFLQGGPGNQAFTIDNVYDPGSGRLWEQFQSTNPPPGSPSGNYANTSNTYKPGFVTGPLYELQENVSGNPNWDGVDWGNQIQAATELWVDYFIMAAYQGFALNLPPTSPGAMGSYPLQFVNGSALDLFGLPGSIAVNLNTLGNVTIQSMTLPSRLSGLTEIDAWGSTGTVTLTGLAAGGSTLIGGDNITTINGYGRDTIIAGAGFTTINTGSGGSSIQVTGASSAINLFGNGNTVTAVGGSTVNATGTGDVIKFQAGGTFRQGGYSSAVLYGNGINIWMSSSGGSVTANGSADSVTGGTGATITIAGNSNVVGSGVGSTVNITGPGNAVYASNVAVNIGSGSSNATVFGANDTITVGGVSTVAVTGMGENITFTSGGTFQQGALSSAVINGNNVTAWMYGTGGSVTVTGTGDTVTGGAKAIITLFGASDTAASGVGSAINVNGQKEVVIGSSMAVAVAAGASASIFGNNDCINAAGGSTVAATGTGEVVAFLSSGTFVLGSASSAVVNGNGVAVSMAATGGSVTVTGNGDRVTGGTSAVITLSGSGDVVGAGAGSTINANGQNEVVNGSAMTVAVAAAVSASVSGSNDTINAARGSTVTATGTGEVLTFQYGGTFVLGSASSAAVVNGSGVTAWMAATGGSLTVTGAGDTVTGGSHATISLSGASDIAGAGIGSNLYINGQGDMVYGSNIAINVGAAAANLQIFGSNNTITVASGETISLTGIGETVNGSNLTLYVGRNSSDVIKGSNDVIAGTASVPAAASVSQTVVMTSTVSGGGTAYEKLSLSGSTYYVQISDGHSLVVNDTVPASAITTSSLLGAPRQMAFLSATNSCVQATVNPDEFVVQAPVAGASAAFTISGFDPTQDVIALSFAVFGNAQQILADTHPVSGGASIASLSGSTHLFIAGVPSSHLGTADFQSI